MGSPSSKELDYGIKATVGSDRKYEKFPKKIVITSEVLKQPFLG